MLPHRDDGVHHLLLITLILRHVGMLSARKFSPPPNVFQVKVKPLEILSPPDLLGGKFVGGAFKFLWSIHILNGLLLPSRNCCQVTSTHHTAKSSFSHAVHSRSGSVFRTCLCTVAASPPGFAGGGPLPWPHPWHLLELQMAPLGFKTGSAMNNPFNFSNAA